MRLRAPPVADAASNKHCAAVEKIERAAARWFFRVPQTGTFASAAEELQID